MGWRIHLSNQTLENFLILGEQSPVLAVWLRANRIAYYRLEDGAFLEEQVIPLPDSRNLMDAEWLASLKDMQTGQHLPLVEIADTLIYNTKNGKVHFYPRQFSVLHEGNQISIENSDRSFFDLAFDYQTGQFGLLDTMGKILIYQQGTFLGEFDVGLDVSHLDARLNVAIAENATIIVATDGFKLVLLNQSGDILRETHTHYVIGTIACSPDGSFVATSDIETGVIRVYRTKDLVATHQRHALDLLLESTQVQLLADLPPTAIAPSALTAYNDGVLAFALSGVVCVTNTREMNRLPIPQTLT